MYAIYLTTDPDTGRGLYQDESKFMGKFETIQQAAESLGGLLRFCSINTISDDEVPASH